MRKRKKGRVKKLLVSFSQSWMRFWQFFLDHLGQEKGLFWFWQASWCWSLTSTGLTLALMVGYRKLRRKELFPLPPVAVLPSYGVSFAHNWFGFWPVSKFNATWPCAGVEVDEEWWRCNCCCYYCYCEVDNATGRSPLNSNQCFLG